jgi:hypothetical protein
MPLEVDVDPARQLVTARGSGKMSDDDLDSMVRLFNGDAEFSRKFSRICDLTDVTDVAISDDRMVQWAEDPLMERSARHAIVCQHPAVMMRVLEFVRHSRKHARDVSVFPTFDQAMIWIEK